MPVAAVSRVVRAVTRRRQSGDAIGRPVRCAFNSARACAESINVARRVVSAPFAAPAALLAVLVAGAAATTSALVTPARGATATSLTATFTETSSWSGGYVGQYTITDAGTTAVSSWQLAFQLPAGASLVNSWSGTATVSGATVSVTNASWNGSLAPGASAVFGFQVSAPEGEAPVACSIDGGPCTGAATASTITSTTTSTTTTVPAGARLAASFVETSSWDGGYVGQYKIADVGSAPVSTWTLAFSLPAGAQLVDLWSGTDRVSGSQVSVTPASWNAAVAPGSSVTFGFQVSGTGSVAAPSACSVSNGSCVAGPPPPTPTSTIAPTSTAAPTSTIAPTSTAAPSTTTAPSTTAAPSTTTALSTTVAPPPPPGPTVFAPYIDMTLQQQNLAAISKASGITDFTLAFVVTEGSCTPSWGAVIPVGSAGDGVASAIAALRAAGGDVIVSFGGEANTELADSCSSVASLEAAYQKVVDTYHVYDLDFDIEGADVGNTASIAERSAALALLQKDEAALGHAVAISLTLPVLPTGFPSAEMNVIRSAVAAGVRIAVVNPMTMDYGGAVSNPAGMMGTYAIQAARSVEAQLGGVFPSFTTAQLWSMVGITPLIGQNDVPGEVFGLSDAQQVASFAAANGVGRLAMWSATRDQQCEQGIVTYDDPTCSGILQPTWAFAHAFEAG
jgi:hypothetical protein